jgi:hypothetical protein
MKTFISLTIALLCSVAYADKRTDDLMFYLDRNRDGVVDSEEMKRMPTPMAQPNRPPFIFNPNPRSSVTSRIHGGDSYRRSPFGPQPTGKPPEFGPRDSRFHYGVGTYWGGITGPYWGWSAPVR